MFEATTAAISLWAGVVAIGIYHGLNPAMGWPLAVAQGMTEKRAVAVFVTWMPLGAGHLLAMALVLVPFALLTWIAQWNREIRIGAGLMVLLFGLVQWLRRGRHPRWLARVRPTQLALWSFLMATAHGAALMLLPIVLGLCDDPSKTSASTGARIDHSAMTALMRSSVNTAVVVSLVHTAAMIASGLGVAWVVYRYWGLQALRTAWIDLENVWALGLVVAGTAAVATTVAAGH